MHLTYTKEVRNTILMVQTQSLEIHLEYRFTLQLGCMSLTAVLRGKDQSNSAQVPQPHSKGHLNGLFV